MLSLNANLNAIGISGAKGIDLLVTRDQLSATLPREGSGTSDESAAAKDRTTGRQELTPEQQRQVTELKATDRKVRAHEQAHLAVGRSIVTSGPNYTYTYGPDGRTYVSGGEVGIDTAAEREPQANIDKGILIQRTALAPQDPSPQDISVASVGAGLEARGRNDLAVEQADERAAAAQDAAPPPESPAATAESQVAEETPDASAARAQVQKAYAPGGDATAASRFSVFA